MTPTTPTISIGLCTFNGERYLPEQLDSIERQTLFPYELVACDDGSTDNTMSILRDFAHRAGFPVRIIQNPARLGVSANFAKAVSECRGDYYAPCDQDDIWLPERLETFSSLLSKHPYGLVFSDAFLIDDASQTLHATVWKSFGVGRREIKRIACGRVLELLVDRTFVTGATMVLSRDLLNIGFPLPPDLPSPILQDAWLVVLAAAREELAVIAKPLMYYRRHAAQQAGVPPDEKVWQRCLSWLRLSEDEYDARRNWYRNWIEATIARAEKLEQLLVARAGSCDRWRSFWMGGLKHLRRRQQLPDNFLLRLFLVLRLAALGAYARYSAGPFTDMSRDILYGGIRRNSRSSSPISTSENTAP